MLAPVAHCGGKTRSLVLTRTLAMTLIDSIYVALFRDIHLVDTARATLLCGVPMRLWELSPQMQATPLTTYCFTDAAALESLLLEHIDRICYTSISHKSTALLSRCSDLGGDGGGIGCPGSGGYTLQLCDSSDNVASSSLPLSPSDPLVANEKCMRLARLSATGISPTSLNDLIDDFFQLPLLQQETLIASLDRLPLHEQVAVVSAMAQEYSKHERNSSSLFDSYTDKSSSDKQLSFHGASILGFAPVCVHTLTHACTFFSLFFFLLLFSEIFVQVPTRRPSRAVAAVVATPTRCHCRVRRLIDSVCASASMPIVSLRL